VSLDSSVDSTVEGLQLLADWESGRLPLLVSCRLDADGVASTRSPDDLVGVSQSIAKVEGKWEPFSIELVDRGVGGKFLTQQKGK